MATIMDWDLQPANDDKLRLIFWDSMFGDDIVLEISPDGKVEAVHYDTDTEQEYFIPVPNIHSALKRALDDYRSRKAE